MKTNILRASAFALGMAVALPCFADQLEGFAGFPNIGDACGKVTIDMGAAGEQVVAVSWAEKFAPFNRLNITELWQSMSNSSGQKVLVVTSGNVTCGGGGGGAGPARVVQFVVE